MTSEPDPNDASTSDWRQRITFWNRPAANSPADLLELRADVAMIGAPWDGGSSYRPGARFGPRAIRASAFNPSTHHLFSGLVLKRALRVVDYGDASCPVGNAPLAGAAISTKIGEIVVSGVLPLLIGGDHSVTIPAVSAIAASIGHPFGIVHIDAHADTDTDIDGDQLSHGCVIRRLVEAGHVSGAHVLQLGLRGLWPPAPQLHWAHEHGVSWLTIEETLDVDRVRRALAELASKVSSVYFTVDLDAVDPAFAPAVGVPEPGGYTSREVLGLVREVCAHFDLVGADVVEFVPAYDVSDLTANVALRVALEMLAGVAARRAG